MSSFTSCKKVELHLHLEGAASPHFVRDICKSSGTQIPEIFDKAGNYKWQNFDQFLSIYEIVTNLFLEEKNRIQNKQDTIFNSFNAIQRLLRNQTLADTYRSDGDRRRHCRRD